jgi:hypothetical protein
MVLETRVLMFVCTEILQCASPESATSSKNAYTAERMARFQRKCCIMGSKICTSIFSEEISTLNFHLFRTVWRKYALSDVRATKRRTLHDENLFDIQGSLSWGVRKKEVTICYTCNTHEENIKYVPNLSGGWTVWEITVCTKERWAYDAN